MRQQKIFRSILNCAVRCCVDLVQQVIQRRARLGGQNRKIAAGGIFRLCQQQNRTIQPVQPFPHCSLVIIRILFRQNGARADALTILHHISQVAAARHIHCLEHCHAFQRDVIRHGVGNGGFGFVSTVEDRVNLDTEIPKHHNQQRRKQGKKNFYECFGLAFILFMHWVSPLWFYGNTAQFPSYGLSTAPAAAARHLRCQNAR